MPPRLLLLLPGGPLWGGRTNYFNPQAETVYHGVWADPVQYLAWAELSGEFDFSLGGRDGPPPVGTPVRVVAIDFACNWDIPAQVVGHVPSPLSAYSLGMRSGGACAAGGGRLSPLLAGAVAFERAMLRDRADDTSRLVYADWLEENGSHGYAASLRKASAASR